MFKVEALVMGQGTPWAGFVGAVVRRVIASRLVRSGGSVPNHHSPVAVRNLRSDR
jgi:hypothetical protein